MHYIFAEAYLSISWVGPAKSLGQSADQTLSLADVPKRDHETALQPGRTLKQHFVKLVLNSPQRMRRRAISRMEEGGNADLHL